MLKIKKLASLLILVSMLAGMTACGGEAGSADTTAADTTEAQTTAAPEVIYDLEGYTLNFAKVAQKNLAWVLVDLAVAEENGDVLNDVMYKRNQTMQEKHNFVITETEIDSAGTTFTTIRNMVNAGDDTYQVLFNTLNSFGGSLAEGVFIDATTIDTLDLTKDCWNDNLVSSLSIGDAAYLIGGDITVADEDAVEIVVFNTTMARDLNLAPLYDTVREGKWTVDKMLDYCKVAARDLDGNTVIDDKDSVGILANQDGITAMLVSCGAQAITKDKDGYPQITAGESRYADALEKILKIYGDNTLFRQYGNIDAAGQVSRLEQGQNLFINAVTSFARRFLRDVKTDFGFLPTPKYDEKQQEYISSVCNSSCGLAIPATCGDLEKTGLILQILAEASADLTYTYSEVCLQSKYTRDEESYEMLEISTENLVYDIGYIYNSMLGGLHGSIVNSIHNFTEVNLASTVDSMKASVEEKIAALYGDK